MQQSDNWLTNQFLSCETNLFNINDFDIHENINEHFRVISNRKLNAYIILKR